MLLVAVYGAERLANRDPPSPQDADLPVGTEADATG